MTDKRGKEKHNPLHVLEILKCIYFTVKYVQNNHIKKGQTRFFFFFFFLLLNVFLQPYQNGAKLKKN